MSLYKAEHIRYAPSYCHNPVHFIYVLQKFCRRRRRYYGVVVVVVVLDVVVHIYTYIYIVVSYIRIPI